jgi:hypothetical protein
MAQPWPHPKTGVFWFRRAVPKDLRALVGKREELASLGTKDPAEARVRYAKRSAEVEARWANLRKAPQTITEREASALATSAHEGWLEQYCYNPSEPTGWHSDLYGQLWAEDPRWDLAHPMEARVRDLAASVSSPARQQEEWCVAQADRLLFERGLRVDEAGRMKLARAVAAAIQQASITLSRAAQGEIVLNGTSARDLSDATDHYSEVPSLTTWSVSHPTRQPGAAKRLSLTGLFEACWQEAEGAGRKPSTHESYGMTIRYLVAFLKHNDAERVTAEDIVAFKDHRLATPSERTGKVPSAKTVKDSDLAALKTLFGLAVLNRKLASNPAPGLTIKIGKKQRLREKGFVETEAQAILSAALHYAPGPREHARTAAAKRWVPWLCAFSGARVGEMAQLRRQDIRREGELWVLRITPEAGTVKTGEAR